MWYDLFAIGRPGLEALASPGCFFMLCQKEAA